MATILQGKPAREHYAALLKERIQKKRKLPALSIIQVGDRPESSSYIQSKIKFGTALGCVVEHFQFPEDVTQKELIEKISELNENSDVDGVIVQLPISEHLAKQQIIDSIAIEKDVDGLTTKSVNARAKSQSAIVPATARGVMELLEFYGIKVSGKKVAVLGRSQLAGGPIAEAIGRAGGKVTVCHSHTPKEEEITRKSDIVIVAIGKPLFVNDKFFINGKTEAVIDVGINRVDVAKAENSKLLEEIKGSKFVGDVDFDKVAPMVGAISPVPGGVGAMTVLGLFENLADCASKRV
jgi:5,10-methylene-tetrahydrofolate dehydrogenase/methenyl tetrahydrofolate cyclohydrolase